MTRPHVTTHLFVDGGRIVKTERSDYSELPVDKELPSKVRQKMKEQHKAVFVALRQGELDALVLEMFPDEPAASKPIVSAQRVGASVRPSRSRRSPSAAAAGPSSSTAGNEMTKSQQSLPPDQAPVPSRRPTLSTDFLGNAPPPASGRPATSFASGGSVFRGASVGEQSLDDVILSYISEDLDVINKK